MWFIDNVVVLAGLAKGHNRTQELDAANSVISLTPAQMGSRVWWEYVESKANWADAPSRLLKDCAWLAEKKIAAR